MTTEQQDLLFMQAKVDRLEQEGRNSERRLLRAEQRIMSLGAGMLWLAILGVAAAGGYLIFARSNDIWDWLGISVMAAFAAFALHDAVKKFDKEHD